MSDNYTCAPLFDRPWVYNFDTVVHSPPVSSISPLDSCKSIAPLDNYDIVSYNHADNYCEFGTYNRSQPFRLFPTSDIGGQYTDVCYKTSSSVPPVRSSKTFGEMDDELDRLLFQKNLESLPYKLDGILQWKADFALTGSHPPLPSIPPEVYENVNSLRDQLKNIEPGSDSNILPILSESDEFTCFTSGSTPWYYKGSQFTKQAGSLEECQEYARNSGLDAIAYDKQGFCTYAKYRNSSDSDSTSQRMFPIQGFLDYEMCVAKDSQPLVRGTRTKRQVIDAGIQAIQNNPNITANEVFRTMNAYGMQSSKPSRFPSQTPNPSPMTKSNPWWKQPKIWISAGVGVLVILLLLFSMGSGSLGGSQRRRMIV